jgi:hypothetical protein
MATLIGIERQPRSDIFPVNSIFIGVSLKLLSVQYVLHIQIVAILNTGIELPIAFWDITNTDLKSSELFCKKISASIFSIFKKREIISRTKFFRPSSFY